MTVEFSIIIPVYNTQKYLNQCLDSIINQTFKDFEVICVNDGSTDKSAEILAEYAAKDNRFIIISQDNQGTGNARNIGQKVAKGKYLVFADPDDWFSLNALEKLHKTFNKTCCEVIQFNFLKYYEYSREYHVLNAAVNIKRRFDYDLAATGYYNWNILKNCEDKKHGGFSNLGLTVWERAYLKSFIDKAGACCSPTSLCEDNLFSIAVILNAQKIIYLDEVLYTYRIHENSALNHVVSFDLNWFKSIKMIEEYLCDRNLYDKIKDDFSIYKSDTMLSYLKNIPDKNKKRYIIKCRELLSKNEWKRFKKQLHKINKKELPLLSQIFSISNMYKNAQKYKVISILGKQLHIKTNHTGTQKISL